MNRLLAEKLSAIIADIESMKGQYDNVEYYEEYITEALEKIIETTGDYICEPTSCFRADDFKKTVYSG